MLLAAGVGDLLQQLVPLVGVDLRREALLDLAAVEHHLHRLLLARLLPTRLLLLRAVGPGARLVQAVQLGFDALLLVHLHQAPLLQLLRTHLLVLCVLSLALRDLDKAVAFFLGPVLLQGLLQSLLLEQGLLLLLLAEYQMRWGFFFILGEELLRFPLLLCLLLQLFLPLLPVKLVSLVHLFARQPVRLLFLLPRLHEGICLPLLALFLQTVVLGPQSLLGLVDAV